MLIIFVHTTPRRVREGKSEVDTMYSSAFLKGFPGLSDGKESAYNAGDPSLVWWVGKIPWRREWQSTRVFLPGKSHGQRSLAGYSPFRILLWKSFRIINSWCWKETSSLSRIFLILQLKKKCSGRSRKWLLNVIHLFGGYDPVRVLGLFQPSVISDSWKWKWHHSGIHAPCHPLTKDLFYVCVVYKHQPPDVSL